MKERKREQRKQATKEGKEEDKKKVRTDEKQKKFLNTIRFLDFKIIIKALGKGKHVVPVLTLLLIALVLCCCLRHPFAPRFVGS